MFEDKKLILLVEDDPEPAMLLTEFLGLRGYKIKHAKDGAEGLDMAQKVAPDLILLDILLPKLNGKEVLLKLKSEPKTKDIPIVMVSALNQISEVERCCNWGANGYVVKPFDLSRLEEKIKSLLANPAQKLDKDNVD